MKIEDSTQNVFWEKEHKFRQFDHPIVSFFAKQRIDYIKKFIDISEMENIFDLGCGSGFSTFLLDKEVPGKVIGGDRSMQMLSFHPMKDKIINLDAYKLPFKDEQFDLVNIWEVLHHIENPVDILSEIRRVTKKYIVIFEPNSMNPAQFVFALVDKPHRWVLRFRKNYIFDIVKKAGFGEIIHYSKVGWIFPNKTPAVMFAILKKFKFDFPLGISQILIAKK